MKVKTTGHLWKRFMLDDKFWKPKGDDLYHDEALILVDGVDADSADINTDTVDDAAIIEVHDGVICSNIDFQYNGPSLASALKRWIKSQNTTTFFVEVDKDKRDELVKAIESKGGKVITRVVSGG